nr:RNA-directed DNA polymerase, eukaryota, reverse transcriptase zinc-binding domain protein [Tanacetum cinerariifolium]
SHFKERFDSPCSSRLMLEGEFPNKLSVDQSIDLESNWKMKTLSSEGRLALLKSVLGSSPIYYMSIYKVPSKALKCLEDIRLNFFIGADVKEKKISWFKWSRVLVSKDKGGLGVSSFFALNIALLLKWMWRFFNDKDALWSRFIRAVHGNSGGIETHSRVSYSSTWLSIMIEVNKMRNKCIDLLKYMKIQVGNGLNTKFWEDVWMGNKNFKTSFPRIFALESDKNLTMADKMAHNDVAFSLRRQPRDGVEMGQFRVRPFLTVFVVFDRFPSFSTVLVPFDRFRPISTVFVRFRLF